MAFVTHGRVVAGGASADARPLFPEGPSAETARAAGRVLLPELADAHLEARAVAERAREGARIEARAEVEAEHAARFLALRRREEKQAELDVERALELAVLLAERLIGEELALNPERIATMARLALEEARGARSAVIEVCPLDEPALRTNLDRLELSPACLEVKPNPELPRGSLSLHTDLGTLDARLNPQLERLAAALRDVLRD